MSPIPMENVNGSRRLSHGIWLLAVAAVLLVLAGCTEQNNKASVSGVPKSGISLGSAPAMLTRAVNQDQLRPEVIINELPITPQRAADGTWSVNFTLFESSLDISLRWIETYNGQQLVLAQWTGTYNNITEDSSFTINSSEYFTGFDDDNDGSSNLSERIANTNPYGSTGTTGNSNSLQGMWFAECAVDDDGAGAQQTVVVYDENRVKNFTVSTYQFIDSTVCDGTNYVSVNLQAIAIISGATSATASGEAQHLDITYINGSISAGDETNALLAEQGSSLEEISAAEGFDNIDLIPLEDLSVTQAEVFTLFQIDAGVLRLGVNTISNNGSSSALRHTSLSTSESFVRR